MVDSPGPRPRHLEPTCIQLGVSWWLQHPHTADHPTLPKSLPDAFWAALPDEATTEAAGTVTDLRGRLDAILDRSAERLAARLTIDSSSVPAGPDSR